MDKSISDSELNYLGSENTPPNFVTSRNAKRRRDEVSTVDFEEFKEDMKNMLGSLIHLQKEEFKNIKPTLQNLEQTNKDIQSSLAFLSQQNEEFKKQIVILENQGKEDRKRITMLEEKIEELQRGNRKNNLEIKNVPKINKETRQDLLDLFANLASTVGHDAKLSDVKDIYRVRNKKVDSTTSSIIVETDSTITKSEILKSSKQFNLKNPSNKLSAKHLGFRTAVDTPIFVTENLTPHGSRLHFLARDLAKTKNYKYCWTAFGKIYVRKTDTSRAINIINEAQVHQLMMLSD